MYTDYFKFNEPPFSIAPDPRYLFMSERHREALAHLIYGLQSDGGFVLLTGDIGTGKTTICRCLLEQIPENTEIALVLNPKVTAPELLAIICDELQIRYPEGNTSIKVFVDCINAFLFAAHAQGKKVVLIIDEAQTLSPDVLEQVRLLTNLETNRQKLLQIIMLGQPELRQMLDRPDLHQLSQRITARYHLSPLSEEETSTYIQHRLLVAGVSRPLFSKACIRKIHKLSAGVPRLINILCDRTLLGTYVQGDNEAGPALAVAAALEVFGEATQTNQPQSSFFRFWPLAALTLLFAGVLLAPGSFQTESKALPPATEAAPAPTPEVKTNEPFLTPAIVPAYKALFDLWSSPQPALTEDNICREALAAGLQCLTREGSLGVLRRMNRPAVLKLTGTNGAESWAALVKLDGETATLASDKETRTLSITDLTREWLGEYTLLWQMPPGYYRPLNPGERGPAVQWAERQLAKYFNRPALQSAAPILEGTLLEELKAFQQAEGLNPDGILGPLTIIHLDSRVGASGPRLLDMNEG